MGWYFDIILGILVISTSHVWANSECNPAECRQLRQRLEKLENVVRGLISIVANKKTGEELTEILALSDSLDSSMNSTVRPVEADQKQNQNAVLHLRGAVKCSLANLLDINHAENDGINPSGKIKATLGENNLLQIEWTPLSIDCIKFSSGVWIRIYDASQKQPSTGENYLAIPQKCLKRRANASFSIALPSSAPKFIGKTCHFELKDVLIQCRVYTVEVVPNYQSLKGKPIFTEIVIPPANDNSTKSLESLISVGSNSSLFTLKWKDNSGCTPQLTSLYLKIFPDGMENAGNATMFLRIPRNCLKQPSEEINIFSLSLPENQTCPVEWVPLDPCRKYQIEIKSEYSNTWTRAPSVWETFTEELVFTQMNPSHNSYDCSSDQFNCDNFCRSYVWICDGTRDCNAVNDEQHCHGNENCEFRCGRQCIPSSLVCDRVNDCFDGSDENNCDYLRNPQENCNQLTNYAGHLNSEMIMCNQNNVQLVKKKVVLVSVPINHTIWLSFNSYRNHGNQTLKIYDGPYWTSPLLLSHNNGSTKPPSIRSSSNSLYIEYPEMYCRRKFVIDIDYTSMDMVPMELEPFFPGCGGYVYEKGVVFSPNNLSDIDNGTECVWFLEAEEGETGIFLKRNLISYVTDNDEQRQPIMTVYDGWNSTGQVLYDGSSNPQSSEILYSVSRKMMIQLKRPTEVSNSTTRWNVATIKMRKEIILGSSGTIESPNYPAAYPNSYDYRWNIVTEPGTKVRLIFAFFKTQEKFDFVSVYDGSSVNSQLLLHKSGMAKIPFTITSSSNELLVRFTSDDEITFPGFLAVYSTV